MKCIISCLLRLCAFGGIVLPFLTCAASIADAHQDSPVWLRLKSSHFEMLTSASEKEGRALILYFEQVRSFFVASTKSPDVAASRLLIVGFNSEKEFAPYWINSYATAYFVSGSLGNFVVMANISKPFYPAAVHEYMHEIVRHFGPATPLWWHEGIADLYSTLKPVGDKVELGEIIGGRYDVLRRRRPWFTLAELMRADAGSPLFRDKKNAELAYAQSWALVHMLFLSQQYRTRFNEFYRLLITGLEPEELFRRIYGKSLPEVQKDLVIYLGRRALMNRALFPVKMDTSAEAPEVAAAGDLEVRLTLANVLSGAGKSKEAGEMLTQLAQSYPTSGEVEKAMGYLYWQQARREEACAHFARAVAMGITDSKTIMDYVRILGETGGAASTIMPLVQKVLVLEPANREAGLRLASLYLSDNKFDLVLSTLRKLGEFAPEEAFYAHKLLARAQIGLKEFAAAKASVEKARALARSDLEKSEVELLAGDLQAPVTFTRAQNLQVSSPVADSALKAVVSEEAPAAAAIPTVTIKGKLQRIDCLKEKLRLIIDVAGKSVGLLIDDPKRVAIKGRDSTTIQFFCGTQPDTRVVITYTPKRDAQLGTEGLVSIVEFLQ